MLQERTSRYGDNVCIRYQTISAAGNNNNNSNSDSGNQPLNLETLTFSQVDKISTYLAHEWAPQLVNVSCVGYIFDDPVWSLLTILAILKLRRTVFPISTRNSESAITHLLTKTQTKYLITTEKYAQIAKKFLQKASSVEQRSLPPSSLQDYPLRDGLLLQQQKTSTKTTTTGHHDDVIAIIHSSGTTSFPKPIHLSNRMLLYIVLELLGPHLANADQFFGPADTVMLTFPLFHGHGIMSLLMIMSLGATAIMFPRLPPLARDAISVINTYGVTVMTVPPIQLEELVAYIKENESSSGQQQQKAKSALMSRPDSTAISAVYTALKQVKYCTYAGAPLHIKTGEYLHSKGLNVRNAFGASEMGFVAGPDLSRNDKHWHHMKPPRVIAPYIFWEPLDKESDTRQLVFTANYPALASNIANRPNGDYATGDLFIQDPPNTDTWRHVGRLDDTLVMKNGEKTNPVPMENEINKIDIVQSSTVIGEGRECTAVLVELAKDQAAKYSPVQMIYEVYEAVKRANVMAPSHSTIVVPQMVYILPLNKKLPTTFKGTIIRKKAIELFQEEIDQMYDTFLYGTAIDETTGHMVSSNNSTQDDTCDVVSFLCQAAAQVLNRQPNEIDVNVSLFDYGLDSLRAIQLRNEIAMRFKSVLSVTNFCFEYPTIVSMTQALVLSLEENSSRQQQEKRYQETQAIFHDYLAQVEHDFPFKATNTIGNGKARKKQRQQQHTVLLTGATGSLGSFLLHAMIHSSRIKKIYCLIRGDESKVDLSERLNKAFRDRCMDPALLTKGNKVQVLPMALNDPSLGLTEALYAKLKKEVTIIQCCGWLLNFNHPIQHYERECIRGLYNLVKFAYRKTNPIHVHVVSSISATARTHKVLQRNDHVYGAVPELPSIQDPHVALPVGYAQSKYIVEQLFAYLSEHKNIPCFVERMGQIYGDTRNGIWNTSEHYPLMMVGGAAMKMMPDLGLDVDWLPVDTAAASILEVMLHSIDHYPYKNTRRIMYHIINPEHVSWSKLLDALRECGIQFNVVDSDVWVEELRKHPDNPAYRLMSYFENNWAAKTALQKRTFPGWETKMTAKIAPSLAHAPVFSSQLLQKCLLSWRNAGFYV
ncbi:hypothetical protein BDB00DRAFT_771221 [Zychaea mexicana]|uniref:uncharacterized protein n=1 Tax=Zychaea mexicana TaxID=64656 RepID=UPI0022FDF286|nr:uncharacterized protein BDB00DRAFT_771221 [Zychaea mexicana]KAI9489192.1 hypothetical protein BDB00DRAFT_771221 [Zychaea mexicana]